MSTPPATSAGGAVEFRKVAPIIPVADLDVALARYARVGFAVRAYDGEDRYGYADRDDVSLHLTEDPEHDPRRDGPAVYLFVSDADALRQAWGLADLPGRLTACRDTPYGLRDFAYVDPDNTLHRVGSPLPAGPRSQSPGD